MVGISAAAMRVEFWQLHDIDRVMDLVLPAFAYIRAEQLLENTPKHKQAAGQRHLRALQEHCITGIKCVYTDTSTGEEIIVATAEWVIYDRERSENEYLRPHYLLSGSWVNNPAAQMAAQAELRPLVECRIKWMAGRPHLLLLYMVTDPAWQKRGAATKCVMWGLQRCKELGIPAYLEASSEGMPVYQRLGFEVVEKLKLPVSSGGDTSEIAVMIFWPPNLNKKTRIPALLEVM